MSAGLCDCLYAIVQQALALCDGVQQFDMELCNGLKKAERGVALIWKVAMLCYVVQGKSVVQCNAFIHTRLLLYHQFIAASILSPLYSCISITTSQQEPRLQAWHADRRFGLSTKCEDMHSSSSLACGLQAISMEQGPFCRVQG
eukprot:161036-Pelagomonas_calceolata.AAC.8